MATVVHILDSRTGGSLVAHIKVGETYHQRKEGVTHQQWYLFNDFLIEPIDKYEAVQFDMNWKVPAILYYVKRNLNSRYNLNSKWHRVAQRLRQFKLDSEKAWGYLPSVQGW